VKTCRRLKVTPHVACNVRRSGGSAIDGRTTRPAGYAVRQKKRKCIEQSFGWGKTVGALRQAMVRGRAQIDQMFTLTMAAYNLVRLSNCVGRQALAGRS